jgi:homoserine kinase
MNRSPEGVAVRVPASTANLGPGFDVLAAALGLHLELEVVRTGGFAVVTDLDLPRGRENLVVQAFERVHPSDGFEFRIRSAIPLSGGLGSSAAAVLAGMIAADRLSGAGVDVQRLATECEGHPDNIAAALHGGIVICDGGRTHRIDVPAGLEAVLVVPFAGVPTSRAREALPAVVPLADATANLAAIATLTLGFARGDRELIAAGLHDRLHQPYRRHLYPRSAALLARAPQHGALGATISGAGPTLLVWCDCERTGAVVEALTAESEDWAQVVRVVFSDEGARVSDVGFAGPAG